MITSITIFTPEISYLEVGQKLIRDKKETDISVLKIKVWFGRVKIYFSDDTIRVYKRFPFIYS